MADIPVSIKVKNYKCFGDTPQGFDIIKPINVIVGRNNSGKSALLDVIQQASTDPNFRTSDSPAGKTASIVVGEAVTEAAARSALPERMSGGHVVGPNHWVVGEQYVGAILTWEQPSAANREGRRFLSVSKDLAAFYTNAAGRAASELALAKAMPFPLEGRFFRKLAAERNVVPEPDSELLDPQPSGQNVTNLIQAFANRAALDRDVVDVVLLRALNSITKPDYSFQAITPRKLDGSLWEIFLREAEKGLIALSASGSGLKTILCVLAQLAIWPIHTRTEFSKCVFAFEELENSLHPALLRRLLHYIGSQIKNQGGCLFLTTHSATAIDMFASDAAAQIIHTSHRVGESATATAVSAYLHRRTLLDDLDIRASDLLQSNGVVWVEGPSDRTLINRWISLWTEGRLREGVHYQCVFYGGRLLAHLSAGDPADADEIVSILRVNRNAAVVMDSDRRRPEDALNATKQRILAELETMEGLSWVTVGREIENYLPPAAIAKVEGLEKPPALEPYQDIAEYLESQKEGAGRRFERNKAEFAASVADVLDRETQSTVLDWSRQIAELCARISSWNRLGEAPR